MEDRRKAYLYITIASLIIGSILIGNLILRLRPVPDPKTGCTAEIGSKTVFLIDHTDGIPEQTRREVISRSLRFIEKEVKEGDLLSVFILSKQSESQLVPEFLRCKPKQVSNLLTEHRGSVEKQFERDFLEPLRNVLEGPIPQSPSSPIAQALTDLSLSDELRGAAKSNLVIVSDLIEHSGALSLYKCRSKDEAIQTFRKKRAGAVERPRFANVRVLAHIIPRLGLSKETVACRDGFWLWFFGDNSGQNSLFIPEYLPG